MSSSSNSRTRGLTRSLTNSATRSTICCSSLLRLILGQPFSYQTARTVGVCTEFGANVVGIGTQRGYRTGADRPAGGQRGVFERGYRARRGPDLAPAAPL